ncbi:MAG: TlpA disulfide reductase family protein [Halofilum sp. (in: g-proteobacteria)]|nr:TlpA disulfide reductase family protein [Halofilum sp. (in: g-proteobacteria)]
MSRHAWVWVVLAGLVGLAGGAGLRAWLADGGATAAGAERARPAAEEASVVGKRRPAFSLPTPAGTERAIDGFDGEVVLLNFWATWCPPCVREVPALVALQDELGGAGLQVVGVALDEAGPVREFAREHGVDYPLLVGSRDAFEIARAYGNPRGTLPYTVVIDRDGTVRATHQGALTRAQAAELVRPYL